MLWWSLIILPLLGAMVVAFAPVDRVKWIALATSTLVFLASAIAALGFDHWGEPGFSDTVGVPWIGVLVRIENVTGVLGDESSDGGDDAASVGTGNQESGCFNGHPCSA